jgi:hypothetical protein
MWRARARRLGPPLLVVLGVVTVFWKLVLTDQYTFLESPDLANQVMPWLQAQVYAIRHWSVLLWDPYEWNGQSLIGQVQPGTASPFTFLLALAPASHGQIQIYWVHIWFVLIHCCAGLFAYWLLADLECAAGAAVLGGIFYATAGFVGNTDWPQQLAAGIWAPLVFLFLFRVLRGRTPRKSAAWCGVSLGAAWLCGHHGPALALSLAAAGVALWAGIAAWTTEVRSTALALMRNLALVFVVAGLVSAVQTIPAYEYGKLAKRWTATGPLTWKDKVEIPEHMDGGLSPIDLLHLAMPGGGGLRSDPFVGLVGLSLAAIALWGAFDRREVRVLLAVGIGSLLYAMARYDVLYGLFYALVPGVEKSRAPIVALSVFHFAVAVLAGIGVDLLLRRPHIARESKLVPVLAWAGVGTFSLFLLLAYLKPGIVGVAFGDDQRLGMIGLIALFAAGLFHIWNRGYVGGSFALVLVGLLLIVEQGNEVGRGWVQKHDEQRAVLVKALFETADVAEWLHWQPEPKRIDVNDDDPLLKFTFGDWYRLETVHAFTVSMLTATSELGWWEDRMVRFYGIDYVVARKPTRDGQREVFAGKSGLKVFANPDVYPRAWTVHQVVTAPDEQKTWEMVRDGPVDLREAVVIPGAAPEGLDTCTASDHVGLARERPSSVAVDVTMACKGLLVISDNWSPGWHARVDGRSAELWKVDGAIRGVVVPRGWHRVTMSYRPFSVYFGLLLTVAGLAIAVVLGRRKE